MNKLFSVALPALLSLSVLSSNLLAQSSPSPHAPRCREHSVHKNEAAFMAFLQSNKSDFASWGIHLQFKDKKLTINNQMVLPLLPKRDDHEDCLLFRSLDYEKSQFVYEAYKTHIKPMMANSKVLQDGFIWFAQQYFYMIGSPFYDLSSTLAYYPIFDFLHKNSKNKKSLLAFQAEVTREMTKANNAHRSFNKSEKSKVVLFTGPYGSAHGSITKAMVESIDPRYTTEILNECDDASDALHTAIGIHSCRLWQDFSLRDGNYKKSWSLGLLAEYLQDFIIQDRIGDLRKKTLEIGPSLLISNVHHVREITDLAHSMIVPLVVAISDYSLPETQWSLMNHMKYPLVSYWIPSKDKNFFRRMLSRSLGSWQSARKMRMGELHERLFQKKENFESVMQDMELFKISGIPVAQTFRQPATAEELEAIRTKFKLSDDPERAIVGLSYGGIGSIRNFTPLLRAIVSAQSEFHTKIQLVILTGINKKLYNSLPALLKSLNIRFTNDESPRALEKSDEMLTVRIFKNLSYPEEVGDFYKTCDLILSKSGGATAAELVATRTPYLRAFGLYFWEVENVKYLEATGLTPVPKNFTSSANPLQESLNLYEKPVSTEDLVADINRTLGTQLRIHEERIVDFEPKIMNQHIDTMLADYAKAVRALIFAAKRPFLADTH